MTPRERVLTAVAHRETDRVPLFYRDEPEVGQRLQEDLGLGSREDLLRRFEIDFRWVDATYVGPPLLDAEPDHRRDIWGVRHRYARSTFGGYWQAVSCPLAGVEDRSALDDYPWPRVEWFDFSALDTQLANHRDYAIMTAPGVASPSLLGAAQSLLGMERAMTDMILNPSFFEALMERILRFYMEFMEKFLAAAARRVDFLRIGDDFGTQRGLLVQEEHLRRFIQPALKALAVLARRHGARYYHHSCGAVRPLIPFFIETGVDVLDPLQVRATGMNPAELKAEFGRSIAFSGGVDEQELLPRGTPGEVRRGVRELLETMAPGGGFFLGPTHNFQLDIPTANIVAMYQAAREWKP